MSQEILTKCLDLFESMYYPKILPNPKYANVIANQLGREEMQKEGMMFYSQGLSPLAFACVTGDYASFIHAIDKQNIKSLNQHFETQ